MQLPHPLGNHWKQSPYKPPSKLQLSAFKLLISLVFTTPAVEDKDFLHPSATGQTEIQVLATFSSIATYIQPPYKPLQASNKHMVNFELFVASFNESSKSPILGARTSS